MSYSLLVKPRAETEILKAARWYDGEIPGLGTEFLEAIEVGLQQIFDRPTLFPEVHDTVRRAVLKRFPYSVFFRLRSKTVVILAVAHQARRPGYWEDS